MCTPDLKISLCEISQGVYTWFRVSKSAPLSHQIICSAKINGEQAFVTCDVLFKNLC